jgi:Rieske Fe-S protein
MEKTNIQFALIWYPELVGARMKNKLSRLSVTILAGLIALGAVLILVNPFYSTTSSAHSLLGLIIPSNRNNPGLSSGQNSTNSGTPFGTKHTANNYSFCPRRLCPDSCAESAKRENLHFNHPTGGSSILISVSGVWKAFSAICTHRPCTVDYTGSSLYCPCHGGSFSTANGAVTGGPSAKPSCGVRRQAVER